MNLERYKAACATVVDQAKARLTLAEVWDMGAHCGQDCFPAHGVGVVKSPLRPDKTPSFSVFSAGKAFDDKARDGVKGGVWEFVQLARPELSAGDVARLLVERAGLRWPDKAEFGERPEARGEGQSGSDDKAVAARLREERLLAKKAEQAQADREEEERRGAWSGRVERASALKEWPSCVEERWQEGAAYRDAKPDVVAKLCEKRGWPVAWSDMLCSLDALAFPVEARYEVGAAGAKRMVAFRVEGPVGGGQRTEDGGRLLTVGMHQKFFNLVEKTSGWRFFPAVPKEGGKRKALERCSSFERELSEVADARRVETGESMVPPLPYVAGSLVAPRLVIVCEGQWDALTLFGALGGLNVDGEGLQGVAIFGVRGAKGTGVFLAHWGAWLRAMRPAVWLLPDNDGEKTGAHWYPPARVAERKPGRVYFSEQLVALGAKKVVITALRPEAGTGKDFNDYYRIAKPDTAAMWAWIGKLKLLA